MSRPVLTMTASTEATEAARQLDAGGYYSAPVVDAEGLLVGLITVVDLLRSGLLSAPCLHGPEDGEPGHGPGECAAATIAQVMRPAVSSIRAGSTVAEAARLMDDEHVSSVPVVEDGRVVGILTRRDLLRAAVHTHDRDLAKQICWQLDTFEQFPEWSMTLREELTVTVRGRQADPADAATEN